MLSVPTSLDPALPVSQTSKCEQVTDTQAAPQIPVVSCVKMATVTTGLPWALPVLTSK